MSTELFLKALIALMPVVVLVIVLYRLDSHRLLGTHFIGRIFLVGGVIAVVCYFVNGFAMQTLGVDFSYYTRYIGPLIEESAPVFPLSRTFTTCTPRRTRTTAYGRCGASAPPSCTAAPPRCSPSSPKR